MLARLSKESQGDMTYNLQVVGILFVGGAQVVVEHLETPWGGKTLNQSNHRCHHGLELVLEGLTGMAGT